MRMISVFCQRISKITILASSQKKNKQTNINERANEPCNISHQRLFIMFSLLVILLFA